MAQVSVKISRVRHMRRRTLRGLTRGVVLDNSDPGVPRLKKYGAWLDSRETTLAPTATVQTFTANNATDELTVTGHGYSDGSGPLVLANSGGALPAGLSEDELYWASVVDVNTIQLHYTESEAARQVNPVDFTDNGSGTNDIRPGTDQASLQEHLRQRLRSETLQAETDIDNLV